MLEKVFLRGTITALTGLRIGGSDQALSVAGVDHLAARHALLDEPYLPGSSIRGKIRCGLERLHGIAGKARGEGIAFGPADDATHPIVQLFGAARRGAALPSRVLVRDALLTADSRRRLSRLRGALPMTEAKTEAAIDRVTSASSPRTYERVPAGAAFHFEIVLEVRALPADPPPGASDEVKGLLAALRSARHEGSGWGRDEDLRWLLVGLQLLQDDALGGHASRGYGRVKVRLDPPAHRTRDDYLQGRPERPLDGLPAELAARIADLNACGEPERARIAASLAEDGGHAPEGAR
ncbi:MAG: type III-A CRISPR-associated RAMP protein Csm3 [Polyangiaceae bacterium]|nr:type III-A CRISPR-associated RAMP protein Csm3 [Polyangiaceae bacterium]